MAWTLEELAKRLGGEIRGDGDIEISGVGSLTDAGDGDLAFLARSSYQAYLAESAAAAVILAPDDARDYQGNCIVLDNPHVAFAKAIALIYPETPAAAGVHPNAIVAATANVSTTASVGALSVIEAGAEIGADVRIGTNVWVGEGAILGPGTCVHAHVAIHAGCHVGARCTLFAGTVIGSDGFGYANDAGAWVKIPHRGAVVIGDDVSIGANATIDRGVLGDTRIDNGVKLDNHVHIAHNVHIGEHTAMAAFTGVAGSTRIGRRCTFGGRAGVLDHLEIVDDVHVTATSLISRSILCPGTFSSTLPAEEADQWRKNVARLRQLDKMARKIGRIEKQLVANSTEEDI